MHDPTGYGFQDAEAKILRINDYDISRRATTASEEVYVCLENCRRLARFGWTPTTKSVERITAGVSRWSELTDNEKSYFTARLKAKYLVQERPAVKIVYDLYGWGFAFNLYVLS